MSTCVLAMAYGSPRSLEEVAPYLKDIRGGREPSPQSVAALERRYTAIGGRSPLLEITRAQAAGLSAASGLPVYVGMKHWHPYIREAVEQIAADGHDRVIGLALAPHYASISIGGYEERIVRARDETRSSFELAMVKHWYDEPAFVDFAAAKLRATVAELPGARVFFTAHSLPARILDEGDPYLDQLLHSSKLVAEAAAVSDYEFAFQSASQTGEPWLGPEVFERLEAFASDGGTRAVVAPIGFTADHLEILYDVDVDCSAAAAKAGIELRRTQSPNDDPAFVAALANVVRRYAT